MSRLRVVSSILIVRVLLVAEVLDVNSVILIIANIDARRHPNGILRDLSEAAAENEEARAP